MGKSASFLINYLLIEVKYERTTSLDFSCSINFSAQSKHLVYSYQEPTGTCTEWSLKPKIPSALLCPHYLGTNALIPPGMRKVAGLKELLSGKPHGQPPNSLRGALGTQLPPVGTGNASSVSAQRWRQPVRLKGRGLPASVLKTPCISQGQLA